MSELEMTGAVKESRDRSGLLIFFGIIEILIGLFSFLLAGLIALGAMMLSRMPADKVPKMNPAVMIQSGVLIVAVAGFFLWMGVATIKGRRWARSIMLTVSWVWLLFGVFMMGITVKQQQMGLGSSAAASSGLPASASGLVGTTTVVFMSFLFVVLPLALVLFYQNAAVKETFERKDPKRRWTDACAQPVLALSLVLGGLALGGLMSLEYRVYPMFGRVFTGTPATLIILVHFIICVWLARATYQCRMVGWWGVVVFIVLIPAISVLGFGTPDAGYLMEKMGVPVGPETRSMMPWVQAHAHLWGAMYLLAITGYLLYVRKFFKRAAGEAVPASS